MKQLWDAIASIRSDLARLAARVPLRLVTGAASADVFARILDGNTISGSNLGIKKISTTISSIPTAYSLNPAVPTTCIDGVGRAQLLTTALAGSGEYVYILNDFSSTISVALLGPLSSPSYAGDTIFLSTAVNLTVDDAPGTTVTAYRVVTM